MECRIVKYVVIEAVVYQMRRFAALEFRLYLVAILVRTTLTVTFMRLLKGYFTVRTKAVGGPFLQKTKYNSVYCIFCGSCGIMLTRVMFYIYMSRTDEQWDTSSQARRKAYGLRK